MPNSLDPGGPVAATIAELWWIMFFLGTAVFLLVIGLMLFGLFRRRDEHTASEHAGNRWIMIGGIIMPAIILAIVFVFTIRSSVMAASINGTGTLTIEVTGRRWWWEVNYPEQQIITANEIHLPAGVPVDLILTSDDVIHSFWVPQLGGKMDLIPGRENRMTIQADETGVYRGECAEFCGLQHARMQFLVIVQHADDFDQWISNQQQPMQPPANDLAIYGQDIFLSAGCVYCHTIRGQDTGDIDRSLADPGPDLTHLASRSTIGAGIRQNNRGNLSGWISNPHGIKPGVLMPATFLSGEDLQALLAFLETLQ